MLQNVAERIYEDHNLRVPDRLYDLIILLGNGILGCKIDTPSCL